jgi:transcriptional regulator with XRE-family HTH domain
MGTESTEDKTFRILANNVSKLRKLLGYSQEEFSDKCGVSRLIISNIESGKAKDAKVSTIIKMAKVFGTTPEMLLIDKGV